MATESFRRYLVRGPSPSWWRRFAETFLVERGWYVIAAASFSYTESYGFDEGVVRNNNEATDFNYALRNCDAVVEYRGEPTDDSIFDPQQGRHLIDDVLAFTSLYSGVYCQYLWKEYQDRANPFSATPAFRFSFSSHADEWAASHARSMTHLEEALSVIPSVGRTQFQLAIRWFYSALTEFEIGRPLVDAALNWVCLESQANYLKIPGRKFERVQKLLNKQGFQIVPRLGDLYKLRNDAFHDGALSNLGEPATQAARLAGRTLVRAQILNLIGMAESDFRQEFVAHYAR